MGIYSGLNYVSEVIVQCLSRYFAFLLNLLMSIYEKALKNINAVFPKLRINKPTQTITVRSLIQEVQVPGLTNHDFSLLRNFETAPKILNKISKMMQSFLRILENNELARQQQLKKKLNKKCLEQYQQIYSECIHIKSKSQFLNFMQNSCASIYSQKMSQIPSVRQYKEVLISNSVEYYNTITQIDEDQYFKDLEELTQTLNILYQLCQSANNNANDLDEFYGIIQKYDIFKKKDNPLTRVINYNLRGTIELSNSIQAIKTSAYRYAETLTFSLARCYYLCFMAREEIIANKWQQQVLKEIKSFLCDRLETVFPKLYNRKINKCLVLFDAIDSQIRFQQYEAVVQINAQNKMKNLEKKVAELQTQIEALPQPFSQPIFLKYYPRVESLLIETKSQEFTDLRSSIFELQEQLIKEFVFPDGKQDTRRHINKQKSIYSQKSVSNHPSMIIQEPVLENQGNEEEGLAYFGDIGQDIFLPFSLQPDLQNPKNKQLLSRLEGDPKIFQEMCGDQIKNLTPDTMEELEDMKNYDLERIKLLISYGKKNNADFNELRLLQTTLQIILKPEISQEKLKLIFIPKFRPIVLKALVQKLHEYRYKLNRLLNSSTFSNIPANIQNAVICREHFLKCLLKQLESLVQIGQAIAKLTRRTSYDVCDRYTFYTFLRVLLGQKQCKFYGLSFQDQKGVPKKVKILSREGFYQPFLKYLENYFPKSPENSLSLAEHLEYIQFFCDYKHEVDDIIDRYIQSMENDQQNLEELRQKLITILEKWLLEAQQKMKIRYNIFIYEEAQKQSKTLKEVMLVLRHQLSKQPKSRYAIRMTSILNVKQI